jgi:protein-disulfide isomerase
MTTTTTQRRARNRRQRERDLQRRRPARDRRQWLSLPVLSGLAVLAGVVVIAAAVVLNDRPGTGAPVAAVPSPVAGTFSDLPADGFALGHADAPVTIDLYEDFQCPACQRWGESVFPTLVANELASGTARLVFHDFAFLGPESLAAARAGHAAANQGRFWDMWATIYANQGPENSGAMTPSRLVEMASGLGLDVDRFTADMELAAAGPAVDASIDEAQQLGVNSTPTIAINGRLLVGASYEAIAAAVADAAD